MGTITGQLLADKAAGLIHDTAKVRWTDVDWLSWLNDGQRDAVLVKPDINVANATVALVPNTTKQSLPSDGTLLIDLVRNMGSDGATPGRAIRVVSKDSLDATSPTWHTDPAIGYVTNYVYDPRDPKNYYIYPQVSSTYYVEMRYARLPVELASLSDTISLDDIYANAILNYMLFRAYSRDSVYADHANESQMYYQLFLSALGVVSTNELRNNPNLTTGPHNSEVQAAAAKPA